MTSRKDSPSSAAGRARPGRPRKRFGQHFLAQPEIARRIVSLAELDGQKGALEIGPGRGALTELLARSARELWLVEIDRDLTRQLEERYASSANVRVIQGDVLELDLEATLGAAAPVVVVSNLPYNISTPVLMKLLETPHLFSRLVLMLQREVAERLTAGPGTKVYGALSVMVQLTAAARVAFHVSPGSFRPPPKVDSTVIVVEPRRPAPFQPGEIRALRRIVRAAFGQRRKQLGNALGAVTPEPRTLLESLALDPRRRPETLAPADFVRIASALGVVHRRAEGLGEV